MSKKVYKEAEEAEAKSSKGKKVTIEDAVDRTHEFLEPDEPQETDELAELRAKLEDKAAEAAKNNDLYLRARADLENYKIRAKKEREEYIRHASDRVVSELLGIVDNMERALEHSDGNDDFETLSTGLKHIHDNMVSIFASLGLKPVEAVGESFDPNLHEAISHEESTEFAPGTVAREFKKGYFLNDRLLRPASVSVAKEAEAKEDEESE
jgi:molecular chaperone GrpE